MQLVWKLEYKNGLNHLKVYPSLNPSYTERFSQIYYTEGGIVAPPNFL